MRLRIARLNTSAAIDISEISLKLLISFDDFLGMGIIIAFYQGVGPISPFKTKLEVCLNQSEALPFPILMFLQ